MSRIFDAVESMFNILGIAIGVNELESWLGVTLLVVNLVAILIRSGIKVYDHLKHGRVNNAVGEIDKARDEINRLDGKENGNDQAR